MRYGHDLGCRFGQPHELVITHENPHTKWERCKICRKNFRWNKGYRGRVKNTEYLKAHLREYAQRGGATKRVYNRLYKPDKCIIYI